MKNVKPKAQSEMTSYVDLHYKNQRKFHKKNPIEIDAKKSNFQ